MRERTYFKVNRARFGKDEFVLVVDGLVPIPPPGTRVSINELTAEVISSRVDIAMRPGPTLYEQTIFCNERSI